MPNKSIEYLAFAVAAIAAGGTIWQAWISSDLEKRQLRAYLVVEDIEINCPSCEGLIQQTMSPDEAMFDAANEGMILTVKNGGLTPAQKVSYYSGHTVLPLRSELPADFPFVEEDLQRTGGIAINGGGTISPQQTIRAHMSFLVDTATDIVKTSATTSTFYYYGHIDYFDVFDRKRRQNFCYEFNWTHGSPNKAKSVSCPLHNGEDYGD